HVNHSDVSTLITRDRISCRRFNIDHHSSKISRDSIRAHALRFGQIDRPRRLVRLTKSRTISEHLTLFPSDEVGKCFWTGRTLKSKETVAVNSRVPANISSTSSPRILLTG